MISDIDSAVSKNESVDQLPQQLRPTFYPENPNKVFWLTLISGGFYGYLWFYRHWRHFKRRAVECEKLNIENEIKYETDSHISPFWSTWFCQFYIVGTARRIRDRLRSTGSSEWRTGPWWAFWLYAPAHLGNESTEDIYLNIAVVFIGIFLIAISSWQITRLQIKANESIILSKELEYIANPNLKKWDICIVIFGFIISTLIAIGSLVPTS